MYAIVESGGKQYKLEEGGKVRVEKLAGEVGDCLELDKVLALAGDDFKVGNPYLEGAKVQVKILDQGKEKKIVVGKFKAKKGYKRKQGHRQPYTLLAIEKIEG